MFLGLLGLTSFSAADEAEAIREARGRSNRAIVERDLGSIEGSFTENGLVVTSRSAVSSGRAAQREGFATEFRTKPDVSYVREPAEIEVFAPWEMAAERGTWRGRWTAPDGVVSIGGTYFAKWRKVDGRWLIEAEVFVPGYCQGGRYCEEEP
jgi:ketosteroid isomerase-like protein